MLVGVMLSSILCDMATSNRQMVRLDRDVVRALKIVAAQRGTTIQALVETAVLQWCKRYGKDVPSKPVA